MVSDYRMFTVLGLCSLYIQGVSRLVDITAGGDFLGLCDQKSSYKHVSDFELSSTGPRWHSGLRCCATNLKVAGLIPAGVIGIFH